MAGRKFHSDGLVWLPPQSNVSRTANTCQLPAISLLDDFPLINGIAF